MDGLILGLDLCDGYTQLSAGGGKKTGPFQQHVCRQKDGGWLIGETALCHSSGWRRIRDGIN